MAQAKIRSVERVNPAIIRALKALPELARDDEQLGSLASGRYDDQSGVLAVTDRRAVWVSGIVRRRVETFAADEITSVQSERGFVEGRVIITVAGNRAVIRQIYPRERAEEIAYALRSDMKTAPTGMSEAPSALAQSVAPAAQPVGGSVAKELAKLADLHDRGVLSDTEFDAQKRKLLDK